MSSPGAASQLARQPSAFYKPELDALRFFAFLIVFVSHVGAGSSFATLPVWLSRSLVAVSHLGGYGVDLFFILSAYLITELLLRERERLGTIHVRAFYLRRILRIWPLYFFAIVIAVALGLFDHTQHITSMYLVSFLCLAGNWVVGIYGWPASVILTPLWSISMEEQFYLSWPPLLRRLTLKQIMVFACGLIFAATVARFALVARGICTETISTITLIRMDPMALGILVAVWLHGRRWSPPFFVRPALFVVGLMIWLLDGSGVYGCEKQLLLFPVVSLGTLAIFLAVIDITGWGLSFVGSAPLRYLGKISYGLYVYHSLALWIAANIRGPKPSFVRGSIYTIGAFLLTVMLAAVSYRVLETPFLRLKLRYTFVESRQV